MSRLFCLFVACTRPAAPDVYGTDVRTRQPFSLASLRGKTVALAFGYTHCADVCPLTLKHLERMYALAGDTHFAAVYASVDPDDTVEGIRAFMHVYDSRIIPIKLSDIPATLSAYQVIVEKRPPTLQHYLMPERPSSSLQHTAGVWLVDSDGRWRDHVPDEEALQLAEQRKL